MKLTFTIDVKKRSGPNQPEADVIASLEEEIDAIDFWVDDTNFELNALHRYLERK